MKGTEGDLNRRVFLQIMGTSAISLAESNGPRPIRRVTRLYPEDPPRPEQKTHGQWALELLSLDEKIICLRSSTLNTANRAEFRLIVNPRVGLDIFWLQAFKIRTV